MDAMSTVIKFSFDSSWCHCYFCYGYVPNLCYFTVRPRDLMEKPSSARVFHPNMDATPRQWLGFHQSQWPPQPTEVAMPTQASTTEGAFPEYSNSSTTSQQLPKPAPDFFSYQPPPDFWFLPELAPEFWLNNNHQPDTTMFFFKQNQRRCRVWWRLRELHGQFSEQSIGSRLGWLAGGGSFRLKYPTK